ncbi:MAG TPA: LysM peptidoglycan-binding domain-containing protein [Acidimicrobiales bacterium]|jgi:hypothetical protein|nr:LysM peptidoglycan-binding domain-containing protein [Acidimicrobiales bacterium]
MAALTYPINVIPQWRLRVVDPVEAKPGHFRELPWSFQEPIRTGARIASIDQRRRRRAILARRRRLAALFASIAILLATWGAVSALAGTSQRHLVSLPDSYATATGAIYTVQPGDTVWSIASRLDPSGDPRPLVSQIDGHLHGGAIVPGERIFVP